MAELKIWDDELQVVECDVCFDVRLFCAGQ